MKLVSGAQWESDERIPSLKPIVDEKSWEVRGSLGLVNTALCRRIAGKWYLMMVDLPLRLSPLINKSFVQLVVVFSVASLVTMLFKRYGTLLALPAALFPIMYAATPTHVPLATSTVALLGQVSDPVSNTEGIFHDGGGGATQNGYHVMVFADSDTTSNGFNFVHNSVAYFGFVGPLFNKYLGLGGVDG